jgi:hypothetical protein
VGVQDGSNRGGLPTALCRDKKGPCTQPQQRAKELENEAKTTVARSRFVPLGMAQRPPQRANKEKIVVVRHGKPLGWVVWRNSLEKSIAPV